MAKNTELAWVPMCWDFLRQQDKTFYRDGTVTFAEEDIEKWFEMWKGFREAGIVPTSEATASNVRNKPGCILACTGQSIDVACMVEPNVRLPKCHAG